ncbi:SRPBCC domain-containing protein [Streptomyces sp. NPDC056161]|uniref:SRPBCC domain-containing protein n=1 Tax=Streptomyces sp. NPDC056161 TaxID=3345732 RepID=UPI0035E31317
MEHEVFVPVPAERLRQALAEPARIARAVPGLQQDAGAEPVAGRLKVRIGGHSITYRGSLRVSARDDGSYEVTGEATEARGTGQVKLALVLRLRDADGGTAVTVEGTAAADGRVAELPADAVGSAAVRLLSRSVEALAAAPENTPGRAPEDSVGPAAGTRAADAAEGTADTGRTEGAESGSGADAGVPGADARGSKADSEADSEAGSEDDAPASVFETEVPPPSPAPDAADEAGDEDEAEDEQGAVAGEGAAAGAGEGAGEGVRGGPAGVAPVGGLPAEAAHARRTMIGRSAEEVDHAPPRGRYAPVPVPETVAANSALRWAAPAAALALASAIVVGRALRRRR